MSDGLYIALCLLVPLFWGVLSAAAFDWWQARRRRSATSQAQAPDEEDMYYI